MRSTKARYCFSPSRLSFSQAISQCHKFPGIIEALPLCLLASQTTKFQTDQRQVSPSGQLLLRCFGADSDVSRWGLVGASGD